MTPWEFVASCILSQDYLVSGYTMLKLTLDASSFLQAARKYSIAVV